ncbi:chlorohydrolase [Streptococcus pneumoniae]|nr:chlorohydrolase [Streptococcus pneumoniae]
MKLTKQSQSTALRWQIELTVFKVVDGTDVFEVVDRTDEECQSHTYGKAKLMRFEEIFEEY